MPTTSTTPFDAPTIKYFPFGAVVEMLEKSKTPNRKLSDLLLDEVVAFCDNINDARHTEGAMKEESIDKTRQGQTPFMWWWPWPSCGGNRQAREWPISCSIS